jgi:TfoX/Sxy family transcriptional regulator of competence genes
MEGEKWTKSPPELVELFHDVFPGEPARSRQMFGYPAGFLNGNMFMALHQDSFIVRLADKDREKLLKMDGAGMFEPMPGKPMREYVVLPAPVLASKTKVKQWVGKAVDYAASLPPKQPKKRAARRV